VDDREAYEFYADPANLAIGGPARKRAAPHLTSMTSVRFAPDVIEAVKERAFGEGVTVGSWIRRLVGREIAEPRVFELAVEGEAGPVRVPAEALERLTAALMPALLRHGTLSLRIGSPAWRHDGDALVGSLPVGVERPEGVIEGSGVAGEPRAIPSTLSRLRTFSCPHFSIANVTSAACVICGPLGVAA
jgi:hypothetical protein